jgi:non-canonical (house-cleaning) NTP pyrophosphatase
MIIYVGSTRSAKLDGTRLALEAIGAIDARFRDVDLRARDLTAVAPRMPMTEAEIVAGARVRVEALLKLAREDGAPGAIAIGLEGGLAPAPDGGGPGWPQHTLRAWACASNGRRSGLGAGGAIAVPDDIVREVAAGRELGDVIDERAGFDTRSTRGAWGVLTRDLFGRREAFRTAVLAALAPFYNTDLYELQSQDSGLSTQE